jgi:hypothetical protein
MADTIDWANGSQIELLLLLLLQLLLKLVDGP